MRPEHVALCCVKISSTEEVEMSQLVKTAGAWILICGALLMLAPAMMLFGCVRLWRQFELVVLFRGDKAAQDKSNWISD